MEYIKYNREERDLCAHLFRLLLDDQPNWGPLKDFLKKDTVNNPRIFCEAALIRDAYHARKPKIKNFMISLCNFIVQQNEITNYTEFDKLQEELQNPSLTHPKQIAYKIKKGGFQHKEDDLKLYGTLQAMFNAKPDLVICEGSNLYIYEAKYTLNFDPVQLERTEEIGKVWQKLLYGDIGFNTEPKLYVRKLGLKKYEPDAAWEDVFNIAVKVWGQDDFSTKVFSKVFHI